MLHRFPEGFTLDECRLAIAGRDEFFIKIDEASGIAIANYLFAGKDTFVDPMQFPEGSTERRYAEIRRECRGIEFDLKTGCIVTRKFHKFSNCGQWPESSSEVIDWSQPHVILAKLDGSMITFHVRADGGRELHSKMGRTDMIGPVERYVEACPLPYWTFADAWREAGYTVIFEWCSRQQRIVVDYPVEQLVLTAVRHTQTGQYVSYPEMVASAAQYGIPVVTALPNSVSHETVQAFLAEAAELEGDEGYVIRFDTGHMVKIKARAYVMIHGAKDLMSGIKGIWGLYAQDRIDDFMPLCQPGDRLAVERFCAALDGEIARWAGELQAIVEKAHQSLGDDRKRFALEVVGHPDTPAINKGPLFRIWLGDKPVEVLRKLVSTYVTSETRIAEIRPYLGNIDWWSFYLAAPLPTE